MVFKQLTSFTLLQKKKDSVLYRAKDSHRNYILKAIIPKDNAIKQAFYDEYSTLSLLNHPSVPKYYGIHDFFRFPHSAQEYLTLCMEDCSVSAESDDFYSLTDIIKVLLKTEQVLSFLLDHGVLYTDLNPSNLIISRQEEDFKVTLIDYTYCYYFLRNPRPDYTLRFSYDLTPGLKGQQLLIQELTYLFYALLEKWQITDLPSSIYRLLETGKHPSEHLALESFAAMLEKNLDESVIIQEKLI